MCFAIKTYHLGDSEKDAVNISMYMAFCLMYIDVEHQLQ
jgi:hypothetical protein